MNKFSDLSYGTVIILIIAVIIITHYCYIRQTDSSPIHNLDLDGDGKVSRSELKHYLLLLEKERSKKRIHYFDIIKSMGSGFVRGLLMGLILQDFEGGLTLGLVLGLINPVLTGLEKMI